MTGIMEVQNVRSCDRGGSKVPPKKHDDAYSAWF